MGLRLPVLLYLLTASADAALTAWGLAGDLTLEGNLFLRHMMEHLGPLPALALVKGVTGVVVLAIAHYGAREIARKAPWIQRVPMLPVTRAWMASGDRSWIALIPLYATSLVFGLAALSWAALILAFGP